MALKSVASVLAEILDRKAKEEARIFPRRVAGRASDGTTLLEDLRGECVVRSGICSVYTGQIVDTACSPPLALRGAAGVAVQRVQRTARALKLETLDPGVFLPGSHTATVTGYGFRAGLLVDFLEQGDAVGEINPEVTVEEVRVIDEHTAEIDLVVATGAAAIEADTGDLAYDIPGSLL